MIRNLIIAAYILFVLILSATAKAGILPNRAMVNSETNTESAESYNFQSLKGQLVLNGDGEFVLVTEKNELFAVQSKINLINFLDNTVEVSGIILDQQLAPSYEARSQDPLPRIGQQEPVVFFVFGIKSAE